MGRYRLLYFVKHKNGIKCKNFLRVTVFPEMVKEAGYS